MSEMSMRDVQEARFKDMDTVQEKRRVIDANTVDSVALARIAVLDQIEQQREEAENG